MSDEPKQSDFLTVFAGIITAINALTTETRRGNDYMSTCMKAGVLHVEIDKGHIDTRSAS